MKATLGNMLEYRAYLWDYVNKKNRRGIDFVCQSCATRGHADVLAARNLVRKAQRVFPFRENEKELKNTDSFLNASALGGGVS